MSGRTVTVILLAALAAFGIYHLVTAPPMPPMDAPAAAVKPSPAPRPAPAPSSMASPAERTPMDDVAEDAKRTLEEIKQQQEQEMMAKPPDADMQMKKAD